MPRNSIRLRVDGLYVRDVTRGMDGWVVQADSRAKATCPVCQTRSSSRHSRYIRQVRDLPVQGVPVRLEIRANRWCCLDPDCPRQIFTERLPDLVPPHGRRTERTAAVLRVFAHGAGGRPAELLLGDLGVRASRSTVLRHLRRHMPEPSVQRQLRVVGIDDWAWSKGHCYGTIIIDLERR
jgi:transposase